MAKGLDASVPCTPFIDCILAWGAKFVFRYYTSGSGAKLLRAGEAQALSDAGLDVVVVYQVRQNQVADFSYDKGRAAAETAIVRAGEVGQPSGSAIYFSVDYDAAPAHVQAGGPVAEYFRGVSDVWGERGAPWRVGVYGSGRTCGALLNAGRVTLTWLAQATGWAGFAAFKPKATVVQGRNTKICGDRLEIDEDLAQVPDFGGFRVGAGPHVAPAPAPASALEAMAVPLWIVNPKTAAFPQPGPKGQVVLAVPGPLDVAQPVETVVFFHGWRTDIARKLEANYRIVSQVAATGRNAVVVAPQLMYQANSGASGNLGKAGGLKALLDDVAQEFETRAQSPKLAAALKKGPVVVVAFSGGFVPLTAALSKELRSRISGVVLLDAAYGDFKAMARGFATLGPAGKRSAVFASWHGDGTDPVKLKNLRNDLLAEGVKVSGAPFPLTAEPGAAYVLDVRTTKHESVPTQGPPAEPLAAFLRSLPAATSDVAGDGAPMALSAALESAAGLLAIDANHLLKGPGVSVRITNHKKSGLKRRFIVLHYTAGGSAATSVALLEKIGLSAHVVVDRDGTIIQTVPFDHVAYHAGQSEWEGYSGLNSWAIGIEIANYGWLPPRPDGSFQRLGANGKPETPRFDASQVLVADHPNGWPKAHGWELYPDAQRAAVRALCQALLARYPDIVEIVGHDEIAPARKQDPGPALDMAPFRHLVEARNVDKGSRYEVIARDGANLRAGPGTEFKALKLLPERQTLFGKSKSKEWLSVDLQGDGLIDGFVHLGLLRRVQ